MDGFSECFRGMWLVTVGLRGSGGVIKSQEHRLLNRYIAFYQMVVQYLT